MRRTIHPGRLLLATLLATVSLSTCCGPATQAPGPSSEQNAFRIAVMAPAAAEMLQELDLLDRVVGIGDFVVRPESILHLPRVGSYDAPNIELLLSLKVDLLITTSGAAAAGAHQRLEEFGVEVMALDTSTYEGVFQALATLGNRLGKELKARELEQDMLSRLEAVRSRAMTAERRRVLFVVGRDPLFVAGPGSHIDVLMEIAGGENVAADAASSYQMVSLESMLQRMPEVIIDTSDNRPGAVRGRNAGAWKQWKFVPAVRDDRVFLVDPERLVIPGMRLPEMAELLGSIIHPEIFGEPARETDAATP